MGIEDFSTDLSTTADQIIVVGTNQDFLKQIGRILAKRNYAWSSVSTLQEACGCAIEQLYDALIVDNSDASYELENIVEEILGDGNLKRMQGVIIHPNAEEHSQGASSNFGENIHLLNSPLDASRLLVKLATVLRLRKFKMEQFGFETKVAEQNAELRDLTQRFQRELLEAKRIHESLLPQKLPSAPQTVFAAYCVPLEAVGGDLYAIWKIDEHNIGLFIGDVTGHGLAAAFIGAMTKMALSYASKESPEVMFNEINAGLVPHMPEGRFVTAAGVIYNSQTGSIKVARAGHPAPYLYRAATSSFELIEPKGLPLGVMEEARYQLYESKLNSGDKLLLISDGLTETANMDGKLWGVTGVGDVFTAAAAENSIAGCLEQVLNAQETFSGGRGLKDDNTLIGFERL